MKAPQRKGWLLSLDKNIICLCLCAVCITVPFNSVSPALSLIATNFGLNSDQRDSLGSNIGMLTGLGQVIGSCITTYTSQLVSRHTALVSALLISSVLGSICSSPVVSLTLLLAYRTILGICQGVAVPMLFSTLADFYRAEKRASATALVSTVLGAGVLVGQLVCGYLLPYMGWQAPFLLINAFVLVGAAIFQFGVKEPTRGMSEEGMEELVLKGFSPPQFSLTVLQRDLLIPTVIILMSQALFNTIPWGAITTHFHDLLATDANLTMQMATNLVSLYGIGAGIGGAVGAFVGTALYARNKLFLPLLQGGSLFLSGILMQRFLLLITLSSAPSTVTNSVPILVLAGFCASINGATVRLILLNVCAPESREALLSVFSLINCVGRGCGPVIMELAVSRYQLERSEALSSTMNLWLVAGLILCLGMLTLSRDEEILAERMRYLARTSQPQSSTTL